MFFIMCLAELFISLKVRFALLKLFRQSKLFLPNCFRQQTNLVGSENRIQSSQLYCHNGAKILSTRPKPEPRKMFISLIAISFLLKKFIDVF